MKYVANTVAEYIEQIPEERREAIALMVKLIRENLPAGYEQSMSYGMLCWEVPLSVYPDTYNRKPLMCVAIASQKNYMALYLTSAYGSPALRQKLEAGFEAAGKKLDMGGGCLRFKKLDDIPLEVIAEHIRSVPMEELWRLSRKWLKSERKSPNA
jgi:hypothetical protein